MKYAIIDDEPIYCSIIETIIKNKYAKEDIYVFYDAASYLASCDNYDITILDIQMPEIDGIELSKQINNRTKFIIFVTSMKERMQEAFGINVSAFILKEELNSKLLKAIDDAVVLLSNSLLVFHTKKEDIEVYRNDIYCIQIENRNVYIYTNSKSYQINRQPLSEIQKKLDHHFIYANQSCIVNINHIERMKNNEVILDNEKLIFISKKYKKEFKMNYLRGKIND